MRSFFVGEGARNRVARGGASPGVAALECRRTFNVAVGFALSKLVLRLSGTDVESASSFSALEWRRAFLAAMRNRALGLSGDATASSSERAVVASALEWRRTF